MTNRSTPDKPNNLPLDPVADIEQRIRRLSPADRQRLARRMERWPAARLAGMVLMPEVIGSW